MPTVVAPPAPPEQPAGRDLLVALLVAAVCLALYAATLGPGLVFPVIDSHELTLNALRLGVAHPSGYPLYTWLGALFIRVLPFGDAAYRMNLMSAVLGAGGLGLLVLLGRQLGLGRPTAAFAALLLGVSTTFWSQAVMAEVYVPDVAMLVLTTMLLVRWAAQVHARRDAQRAFYGFALALGLSLGTHLSNLAFAPFFAMFVVAIDPGILRRPREIAVAFAAFALGAAQYLWLPLRGALFDQYPNDPPVTLAAVYAYTLGAFGPLKFAYPVSMLPIRLWMYLELVVQNFTLGGLALAVAGMWVVVVRHPARFWLLFGMLFINVFLFAQMAVPDPAPFFLAGYVPLVLFAAFGVQGLLDASGRARVVTALAAVALVASLVAIGRASWRENDRSTETLVADFGRNAFAMMPPGSWVTAARGAFGTDMLYWQEAHGLGPDVVVLGQAHAPPRPPGAPLFATVRYANGAPTASGRQAQSAADLPPDAWYVPILFGNAHALTLTRVQDTPPALIASDAPSPRLDRRVGPLTLLAATVALQPHAPSPRLRVESWWRIPTAGRFLISTRMDGETLESHDLGLGNLPRYAAEVGVPDGSIVHERFDVVLPSARATGTHVIRFGVTELTDDGLTNHWTDVAHVTVD